MITEKCVSFAVLEVRGEDDGKVEKVSNSRVSTGKAWGLALCAFACASPLFLLPLADGSTEAQCVSDAENTRTVGQKIYMA